MPESLTLEELAVACRRCGHGFPEHDLRPETPRRCHGMLGGWSSPANGVPCMCPGMTWVDPAGPAVGSYADAPTPVP